MMTAIWLLIRPFALKLALIGAAILTVLAVLTRAKNAGRVQERVEAQARTIETVKRRTEVENELRNERRRTGKSAADRLRDTWSRD